jgi:hypothetical protein
MRSQFLRRSKFKMPLPTTILKAHQGKIQNAVAKKYSQVAELKFISF